MFFLTCYGERKTKQEVVYIIAIAQKYRSMCIVSDSVHFVLKGKFKDAYSEYLKDTNTLLHANGQIWV